MLRAALARPARVRPVMERRCDMREVNVKPQSWSVVDDENFLTDEDGEEYLAIDPEAYAFTYNYART